MKMNRQNHGHEPSANFGPTGSSPEPSEYGFDLPDDAWFERIRTAERITQFERHLFSDDHSATITAARILASLMQGQGQLEEAEALLRKVVERALGVYGTSHPITAFTNGLLGMAIVDQQKGQDSLVEAERLLLDAFEVVNNRFPSHHPWIAASVENLEKLYGPDQLNEPERMDAIRARVAGARKAREPR
jgi:hypothetical protein